MSSRVSDQSFPKCHQIGRFFCSLLSITVLMAGWIGLASAQDAEPSDAVVDHPIIVLATASTDRLFDRIVDVLHARGKKATRTDVMSRLEKLHIGDGQHPDWARLEQAIDRTKPLGMMFFFGTESNSDDDSDPEDKAAAVEKKGNGKAAKAEPDDEDDPDKELEKRLADDEASESTGNTIFDQLIESVDSTLNPFMRSAVFASVKDFPQFLRIAGLSEVPGVANCYLDAGGKEQYVRRFDNCIVVSSSADTVEHCPDPRGLAQRLLGKNDAVASFQPKGLPPLLRMTGAEGIKAVYSSSLQKRDGEETRSYKMRKAIGDVMLELLDMVVSQIDEVNLGLGVDPKTLRMSFDLDLRGNEEGKLTKLASEWSPKHSEFVELCDPDQDYSMALSLSLQERHAKPLAAAIRNYVATATGDEKTNLTVLGPLIEAGCRILDARQLDFFLVASGEDAKIGEEVHTEMVLGIRVPGIKNLPEHFLQFLEGAVQAYEQIGGMELTTEDPVNGMPTYRVNLRHTLETLLGAKDGKLEVKSEQIDADEGTTVRESFSVDFSKLPIHSWLVATPQELWIDLCSNPPVRGIPDLMKSTLAKRDPKRIADAVPRRAVPFRMTMRTRGSKVTSNVTVTQSDDDDDNPEEKERRKARNEQQKQSAFPEFAELYKTNSDRIAIELQPSDAGWKLSVNLDEVYLAMLASQWTDEASDEDAE